jgi:hypothetical protein
MFEDAPSDDWLITRSPTDRCLLLQTSETTSYSQALLAMSEAACPPSQPLGATLGVACRVTKRVLFGRILLAGCLFGFPACSGKQPCRQTVASYGMLRPLYTALTGRTETSIWATPSQPLLSPSASQPLSQADYIAHSLPRSWPTRARSTPRPSPLTPPLPPPHTIQDTKPPLPSTSDILSAWEPVRRRWNG